MTARSLSLCFLLAACTSEPKGEPPAAEVATAEIPSPGVSDKTVGDFTLLDHRGEAQGLYWNGHAKAIVFIGQANGDAALRGQAAGLAALQEQFQKRGVMFFFVNPVITDSRQAVIDEAARSGYTAPILLDPSQVVARELGLTRVGEAVIVDPQGWKLRYRGGLELGPALEALLLKRKLPLALPSAGVPFRFRSFRALTFNKDIATLVRARCQRCHSLNGRYPPIFDSYKTFKGWSSMIRETVLTDRMPPFTADPHYGTYVNDMALTSEEKARLVAWIDSGMERGEGNVDDTLDLPLKVKKPHPLPPKLWDLAMKAPQRIEPKGTVEYLFFEVGGPAPHDMWVTAVNTVSSNPRQLHHESVLVLSHPWSYYEQKLKQIRDDNIVKQHPDGDVPLWTMDVMQLELRDGEKNFTRFGAWAAGRTQPYQLGDNLAYFVPKGSYLVLEVHYVGSGKVDHEQTRIELFGYTNETKPASLKRLRTMQVLNTHFEIPPGEKKFSVTTEEHEFAQNIEISGMLSHLHMRGRAVKFFAKDPDGTERVLASIPNFDFNWHSGYALQPLKRIPIKKGTKIRAVCEYDNSAQNPRNPDPTRRVRHGQTLDRAEMCKFMFSYVVAD